MLCRAVVTGHPNSELFFERLVTVEPVSRELKWPQSMLVPAEPRLSLGPNAS